MESELEALQASNNVYMANKYKALIFLKTSLAVFFSPLPLSLLSVSITIFIPKAGTKPY